MATGRVYFRGLAYDDLHRLQFDLETTALSPKQGASSWSPCATAAAWRRSWRRPSAADEAALIADLCALIRERDPDVIENHNLFGFDLPFLEARAAALGVPLRLGRGEDPPLLERYDEPTGWGRGRRARYSIAGRELIDTLDAVRRHDFVDPRHAGPRPQSRRPLLRRGRADAPTSPARRSTRPTGATRAWCGAMRSTT